MSLMIATNGASGQTVRESVPALVSSIKLAFSILARPHLRPDIHNKGANCGVRL